MSENRQITYCASTVSEANCEDTGYTTGKTFYGYDGEGRRVAKTTPSGTEVFVYDALGRLAAEYGGTQTGNGLQYLTVDHLGSTRVITDASRTVVECKDYLPFGDEIIASSQNGRNGISCYSADLARQKFTGYERDSESRLDFAQARYYSWAGGRFNSPDPMGGHLSSPQSLNRYAYVRNDPLNLIDPFGLDCIYANQERDEGELSVVRGDCLQEDDGGLFVDGTINLNSFTLNSKDNTIGFSYKGDEPGLLGQGVLGLQEGSTSNWSVSLFDRSSGSSLSGFGLFQRGQLDSSARQTLSQTYQNTKTVVDPRFIAGFYVASAVAGAGGVLGAAYGPQLVSLGPSAAQLAQQVYWDPRVWNFAADLVQGYLPATAPAATWGGLTGATASFLQQHWGEISRRLSNTYHGVRGSVPH